MLYSESMAKKSKSRSKTTRKKPASKSASKKAPRKRATRTRPEASDSLDAFVDAAAQALGLAIEADWRPAIKANLTVNLEMAALVAALPLPDETEPAPIFRA